jgi:hypothetical protein
MLFLTLLFIQSLTFAFPGHETIDLVVRGSVRDPQGNGLEGATITEKGTRNTTLAGATGQFSITVKDGATLSVSYVGYATQEIAAVSGTDMIITLTPQDVTGTEVVVTALGIRKERAKLSYATQEVKGAAWKKLPNRISRTTSLAK